MSAGNLKALIIGSSANNAVVTLANSSTTIYE